MTLDPSGDLRCRFTKGKGVRFRGPCAVSTTCPQCWLPLLSRFLDSLRPTDRLFPLAPGEKPGTRHRLVLEALRSAGPQLNLRAMRRGSLQSLPAQGVPLDVIMTFSGHKSTDTLRRYLDWGMHAEDENRTAHQAAHHLTSQP